MPPFSRGIFLVGMFLRDNIVSVAGLGVVLIAALVLLFRRPSVRARLRELAVRLPVLGNMLVEAEAGRWTAMLATLLRNRVPLVQSLSLARESLCSKASRRSSRRSRRAVRGGSGLGAALADYRVFDESLVNLINVGERSGRLADMLKSAAHSPSRRVATTSSD